MLDEERYTIRLFLFYSKSARCFFLRVLMLEAEEMKLRLQTMVTHRKRLFCLCVFVCLCVYIAYQMFLLLPFSGSTRSFRNQRLLETCSSTLRRRGCYQKIKTLSSWFLLTLLQSSWWCMTAISPARRGSRGEHFFYFWIFFYFFSIFDFFGFNSRKWCEGREKLMMAHL